MKNRDDRGSVQMAAERALQKIDAMVFTGSTTSQSLYIVDRT